MSLRTGQGQPPELEPQLLSIGSLLFLLHVCQAPGVNRRPTFFPLSEIPPLNGGPLGTVKSIPALVRLDMGDILACIKHPVCAWHCSRLIHLQGDLWASCLMSQLSGSSAAKWGT